MSDIQWKRVKSVKPKPGYRLLVAWDDAPSMIVSFADHVRRGRIFTPLSDEVVFAMVRIGERRRTIEWPEPHADDGEPLIDIDAETLFQMALQQRSERWFSRWLHHLTGSSSGPDAPPQSPPAQRPRAT